MNYWNPPARRPTEQRRWSGGASQATCPSLSIDRTHVTNYRNIAPGQGRAPKLKCRAFFTTPHYVVVWFIRYDAALQDQLDSAHMKNMRTKRNSSHDFAGKVPRCSGEMLGLLLRNVTTKWDFDQFHVFFASTAKVKNAWSYTYTPQYAFMAWCSVEAQEQLYFYLTLLLVFMVIVLRRLY